MEILQQFNEKKFFFLKKSKGEVLIDLKNYNLKFKIPKTVLINVEDWKKNKQEIYKEIASYL